MHLFKEQVMSKIWDVLIVGSGNAALCAGIAACESGSPRVRLAALQVCRAVFVHWANAGELPVQNSVDDAVSSAPPNGGHRRLIRTPMRGWVFSIPTELS